MVTYPGTDPGLLYMRGVATVVRVGMHMISDESMHTEGTYIEPFLFPSLETNLNTECTVDV